MVKFSSVEEMDHADGTPPAKARAVPPRQCMPWRHMRHRHGLNVETEHATYRSIQKQSKFRMIFSTRNIDIFGSEVLGAWIELDR